MNIYKTLTVAPITLDLAKIDIAKLYHIRYRGIEIKIFHHHPQFARDNYIYWQIDTLHNKLEFRNKAEFSSALKIAMKTIDQYLLKTDNLELLVEYQKLVARGNKFCESYSPYNKYLRIKYNHMKVQEAIVAISQN